MQRKKKMKKTTCKRYEVTPTTTPPSPRQLRNGPSNNNIYPKKLIVEDEVSPIVVRNNENVNKELTDEETTNNYNCLVSLCCLNNLVRTMFICKECGGEDLEVSHSFTYGVASCVDFRCKSCELIYHIEPSKSKYATTKLRGRPSVLTYNVNIKSLMNTLYMGCGLRESSSLLSSLRIPNLHRFCDQCYKIVDFTTKFIREVAKACIRRALAR